VPVDRSELLDKVRPVREAYAEHGLATHAAAIAFRLLVALPPAILLSVALLGAFGLGDTWRESIAPPIQAKLEPEVFRAVDSVVEEILLRRSWTLIAFGSALLLWELMRGVRATSRALNAIHDVAEHRPWTRLATTTVGLALGVGACVLAAVFSTIVGGRLGLVPSILRWPLAVLLLGVAVALLVRYGPAERPEPRWASVGSGVVVAGWLILSVAFGIWVREIASYRSATGTLLAFLVLTAYVLGVSAVFLIGVEVDEAARTGKPARRKQAKRR
jgi:membrane protein